LYLQAINNEEYSEQIQQDLNEIEREIEKFK
jgi:hypothetical protein